MAGVSARAIARHGDLNQALVFYHFGSVDGLLQAVARTDAEPSGARTIDWDASTYHLDGRTLFIPCDLPPGDYPLLVGLHDLLTAEPLPAFTPDGSPAGSNLAYLTTLRVTP